MTERPIMTSLQQARELYAPIWRVLHEECGARETEAPDEFLLHWPKCVEYRFMGALGFGGKVYSSGGRWYVSCYSEDETPERRAMIERANERLAALKARAEAAA